jgi:phosphate transport system substrate-binding protein
MKNKLFLKVMAAVTGITLLSGGYAFAAKNITIKGSTTLLPIAQACAEAFMNQHLDVDISVQGGGSGVGIASIIDDTADIGDASRPAKDKEIAMGKENGVDVYENVVALDGIAVIIHPGNPVAGLNKDQIKDKTFNKLALDDEKVRPDALLQASNQAVAMTISRTKGAIGYIGMGYLSNAVKGVNVNGISPTKENVIDGSYILARKLFMYTNGKPKGATADFILFVLSDDGQKIVEKEGFVPIK